MPYASSDDVQRAAGGAEKLQQLTDLKSSGEVDAVTVTEAIEEAESMINSYLQMRFAVPIPDAKVPKVLRRLCARMSVYILRYDREALSAKEDDRQEDRMQWLEGVRKGEIPLDADPRLAESTSVVPTTGNRESGELTITRKKFRDSGFA